MDLPRYRILDCTLRDGNYVVPFQAGDLEQIAGALESTGIDLIEVGHGMGVNSGDNLAGTATDRDYLEAAARTLTRAQWGMFFLPGIGRLEDLDMCGSFGMNFVRIGVNPGDVATAAKYVERAKRLGMTVALNLIKSYVLPPVQLAQQARLAEKLGADWVYLVDSAGGMLPEEIRTYVTAMREAVTVPLGFHGHDNLSLSVANSLVAMDYGVELVDTTLGGIGRGGGNAATEVVASIFERRGIAASLDWKRLLEIAEHLIKTKVGGQQTNLLDRVCGYAQFHSSYLGLVLKYAKQYDVPPQDLVIAVSSIDKAHAHEELVQEAAIGLQQARYSEPQMGR